MAATGNTTSYRNGEPPGHLWVAGTKVHVRLRRAWRVTEGKAPQSVVLGAVPVQRPLQMGDASQICNQGNASGRPTRNHYPQVPRWVVGSDTAAVRLLLLDTGTSLRGEERLRGDIVRLVEVRYLSA